jgi:hypothetical protein
MIFDTGNEKPQPRGWGLITLGLTLGVALSHAEILASSGVGSRST